MSNSVFWCGKGGRWACVLVEKLTFCTYELFSLQIGLKTCLFLHRLASQTTVVASKWLAVSYLCYEIALHSKMCSSADVFVFLLFSPSWLSVCPTWWEWSPASMTLTLWSWQLASQRLCASQWSSSLCRFVSLTPCHLCVSSCTSIISVMTLFASSHRPSTTSLPVMVCFSSV